jgi:DNA-binding transcriptional LysR family regulator
MIFVDHPRHVSTEEAESWLERELNGLCGNGVDRIRLRRLRSASLRFSETWAWMVELECRDAEAACEAVRGRAGLAFLADLRMLGMRPSVALVEDAE